MTMLTKEIPYPLMDPAMVSRDGRERSFRSCLDHLKGPLDSLKGPLRPLRGYTRPSMVPYQHNRKSV